MPQERLLESADVARLANVTPGMIRIDAEAGHLPPVAITRRGVRLFRLADVETYLRARQDRCSSRRRRIHEGARERP